MTRALHFILSLTCLTGLVAGAFFGVIRPTLLALEETRRDIPVLQARIAKLDRRLADLNSKDNDARLPEEMVWLAPERATAELSLQRAVIQLISTQGLTPMSYGARSIDDHKLGFELEAEATLPAFYAFLDSLNAVTPSIAIHTLSLRPSHGFDPDEQEVMISLRMTFWAYWEAQG